RSPAKERPGSLGPLFGGEQVEVPAGEKSAGASPDPALWKPGKPGSKGPIRVGTSGYSFRDWIGPFYPRGTASGEMLPYYAARFPAVELNVTYYRLPGPQMFAQIERKTPPDFEFTVKLPAELTHKRPRDPQAVKEFLAAVQPLQDAGKYQGALAQFPFSFRRTPENRNYLRWLADAYPLRPLVVEFRHESWASEETIEELRRAALDFCTVDEPRLPGLFPAMARASGETGYVRMHGRNAKTWWGGNGSERYNYLYSQEELQDWVSKVRDLAQQAKTTYVFFNNCHAGRAVQNARVMGELLGLTSS
ncbi:MAG: DUF72 domain-containing protein, partial [Candidatus Eisenbacteria bacterium]|nr:DUF72 domain-containing protein [Candidatus Eisenbacteria bacterium]